MSILLTCMYMYHVHAWCPNWSKRDVGSPGQPINLWMVVNYNIDAGNLTPVLCKSNNGAATTETISPGPYFDFEVKDAITQKPNTDSALLHSLRVHRKKKTQQLLDCAELQGASNWQAASQQNLWGRLWRVGARMTPATKKQDLTSPFSQGFLFEL